MSRRIAISLVMLAIALTSQAQMKMFRLEKDSIPLFRGFSVSFDLVGPAMLMLSDHGEYEGALRINLHDQWFPIFEAGLGKANHENDEVTGITYKTTAPYFRIGMDWNILKNKHQSNRMYAGFRYAFTSYKADIIREDLPDPVWQFSSGFGVKDMSCSMHWLEIVFGIDAKIVVCKWCTVCFYICQVKVVIPYCKDIIADCDASSAVYDVRCGTYVPYGILGKMVVAVEVSQPVRFHCTS